MKRLIVTVGLPRSGKSTWARAQGFPIVNPDSIRLAMHGSAFIIQAEPFVWAVAQTMVKSLFLAGHETVILDATNTTAERRKMWKSTEWDTYFKLFHTDRLECLNRAGENQGLVNAIVRMADNWEALYPEEKPLTVNDLWWAESQL